MITNTKSEYWHIRFLSNSNPIPYAPKAKVKQIIAKMEEEKIVERASSSYYNSIYVIVKKDKSLRVCLDARKINTILEDVCEKPMPLNEALRRFKEKNRTLPNSVKRGVKKIYSYPT